jgi:hypothetical protein
MRKVFFTLAFADPALLGSFPVGVQSSTPARSVKVFFLVSLDRFSRWRC